jgi:hypothetical protein
MSEDVKWEYTHDPSIKINEDGLGGATMTDIARSWLKYYFAVSAEDHPGSYHEFDFAKLRALDIHQRSYQNGLDSKAPRVWNLLPANLDAFYKTSLPDDRKWPVMFAPYVTISSKAEFPSLKTDKELLANVRTDTGAANIIEVTINRDTLKPVKIEPDEPVNIDIYPENPLGIPGTHKGERVFFAGLFILLKPLPLGDILIKSKAESPNYEFNVQYLLYNRGIA